MRRAVVTEVRVQRGSASRLPAGAMQRVVSMFDGWGLKPRWIQNLLKSHDDQVEDGVLPMETDLSRNRAGRAPTNAKFTVEIAVFIMDENARTWGALSCRRLTSRVNDKFNEDFGDTTIRRWCRALGAVRRRRYIKPLLTKKHKLDRLDWVLDHIETQGQQHLFVQNYDTCHGDEAWFYLMTDGSVCRVFPDKDGNYNMPLAPKCYHKSRMPKLMFLVVVARPRPDHNFDGKVGIWWFSIVRKAGRSDSRTGCVKGVTDIMDLVTVDATEYRKKLTGQGGVFSMMREKMWWFKKGSGQPEAGKTLFYQHDGARPHTAAKIQPVLKREGKKGGFVIQVVVQPAQSPDHNVDDLGFFASLKSDQRSLPGASNLFELRALVQFAFDEYDAERLERIWRCLTMAFRGTLEADGGNEYRTHRGDRKRDTQGLEEDRVVSHELYRHARKTRDRLASELQLNFDGRHTDDEEDPITSSDDDDGLDDGA